MKELEVSDQEIEDTDHATLLQKVQTLMEEMNEYLEKYPPAEDLGVPSTSSESQAERSTRRPLQASANTPIPSSSVNATFYKADDDRLEPRTYSNTQSHTHSSDTPRDNTKPGKDRTEAPKRARTSLQNDTTASKVRKTSQPDQDILNADFIAL